MSRWLSWFLAKHERVVEPSGPGCTQRVAYQPRSDIDVPEPTSLFVVTAINVGVTLLNIVMTVLVWR